VRIPFVPVGGQPARQSPHLKLGIHTQLTCQSRHRKNVGSLLQSKIPAWESEAVAEFVADYGRRRTESPTERVDPAIKAAMAILLDK
jgi:hypothetical protein